MLLVNSPINSTQVENSSAASSHHSLELSRIGGPVENPPQAQITSLQSEDMDLTHAGELTRTIAAGSMSSVSGILQCHCGKECTRSVNLIHNIGHSLITNIF